jgi:hypothetical protein
MVTSQFPGAYWHERVGNLTSTDAVLDRLVHSAHRALSARRWLQSEPSPASTSVVR